MQMHKQRRCIVLLAGLLLLCPAVATAQQEEEEEGKGELSGAVELLYRNVNVDGSIQKYNEDFDGLNSGGRLGSLNLDYKNPGAKYIDYARVDALGLGGDPYELAQIRFGRKDVYDVRFSNRQQKYLYNLFGLTPDEDANTWDTERRLTDLTLSFYPTEKITVLAQFQENERSGHSLFLKDISRELFRFDTPLTANVKRYTVGLDWKAGPVDIVFRQTHRKYDNQFNNFTEGNLGLDLDVTSTVLFEYEWLQDDRGAADLTTLRVHSPLGRRLDLTVGLYGTLLGKETMTSSVTQNYDGLDSSGLPMAVVDGTNEAEIEADTMMYDVDLSVFIASPVDLHLTWRSVTRDMESVAFENLDGPTTPTIRVDTGLDYTIDTVSAILDVRPIRTFRFRAGYRVIDRKMERFLFNDGVIVSSDRNVDWESSDDKSAVFGLNWNPIRWFKLSADYENGDISQPFTTTSILELERKRARASFLPTTDIKIDLTYLESDNVNTATDFRPPSDPWNHMARGKSYSVSFSHRASQWIDYNLRYSKQEVDTNTAIVFDTAGFGGTEAGNSIFDNDNTIFFGQVNFRWSPQWTGFARGWSTQSDGNDIFLGDVSGVLNDEVIDQKYTDIEVGVRYDFPTGLFAGAAYRVFDYGDINDQLSYDGDIFTVSGGVRF